MATAPTPEQLQARVNALNEAIASGLRSVTLGGQTTTYNTTASLIQARDDALGQLNAVTATRKPKLSRLIYAGRGYDA